MWQRKITEGRINELWRLIHVDIDKATKWVAAWEPLLLQQGNQGWQIDIQVAKARIAFLRGDYQAARAILSLASALSDQRLSPKQEARYLSFKGVVHILDGELRQARETFEGAAKLLEPLSTHGAIQLLTLVHYNLGELYKASFHDYERALYYLRLADREAKISRHGLRPRIRMSEASCYAFMEEGQKALTTCLIAVQSARRNSRFQNRSAFYALAADLMCRIGKYAYAQSYVDEAMKWVDREGDQYSLISLMLTMGRMAYAEMNYSDALDYADQAQALMSTYNLPTQTDVLNKLLADIKLATGDYVEAMSYQTVAKNFIETNLSRA